MDLTLAENYLNRAKEDVSKSAYDDALFHTRKSLEAFVKILAKECGLDYDTSQLDLDTYKIINSLESNRFITSEERGILHGIRVRANPGVHVDLDSDEDGFEKVSESIVQMESLIGKYSKVAFEKLDNIGEPMSNPDYHSRTRKYFNRWRFAGSAMDLMNEPDYLTLYRKATEERDVAAMLDLASGFLDRQLQMTEMACVCPNYVMTEQDGMIRPSSFWSFIEGKDGYGINSNYYYWVMEAVLQAVKDIEDSKPVPLRYIATAVWEALNLSFYLCCCNYKKDLPSWLTDFKDSYPSRDKYPEYENASFILHPEVYRENKVINVGQVDFYALADGIIFFHQDALFKLIDILFSSGKPHLVSAIYETNGKDRDWGMLCRQIVYCLHLYMTESIAYGFEELIGNNWLPPTKNVLDRFAKDNNTERTITFESHMVPSKYYDHVKSKITIGFVNLKKRRFEQAEDKRRKEEERRIWEEQRRAEKEEEERRAEIARQEEMAREAEKARQEALLKKNAYKDQRLTEKSVFYGFCYLCPTWTLLAIITMFVKDEDLRMHLNSGFLICAFQVLLLLIYDQVSLTTWILVAAYVLYSFFNAACGRTTPIPGTGKFRIFKERQTLKWF